MIDYHIHPDYSLDAEGKIRDYCQLAKEMGYKEIGFTPHLEIDPKRKELDDKINLNGQIVSMRSNWLDYYFEEIDKARRDYPELKIRAGLEVGYEEEVKEEIKEIVAAYPFDYLLGAVHCVDHIALTSRNEFNLIKNRIRTAEEFLDKYFAELRKAVASSLFDCLAHIDAYKKYIVKVYGPRLLTASQRYMAAFLTEIGKTNIGIEINLSGLRHELKEIYPAPDLLRKAQGLGVKVFILGSDCHRVSDFGEFSKEGEKILKDLGIRLTSFWRRQRE